MRNVALDLGKRISYCEVAEGQVIKRAVSDSLEDLGRLLGRGTLPAMVAVEACREAWSVMEQLRQWGHVPVFVDTTRARQLGIGHHKRKNDRIDAETLARALAENRLPRAHELSKPRQRLRHCINRRAVLIRVRSQLITAIRGEARAVGVRLKSCDTEMFGRNLSSWHVPGELKSQIDPLLSIVKALSPAIEKTDEELAALSAKEPVIELLQTVPGVGPIAAASFVSVVDDPKRFKNAHQVQAYVGLVPSENTSGNRRLGSITKQGNSYLRAVLVQAAWAMLRSRKANPLKTWARKVEGRRGKRVAVVALARRVAGMLWAMWRNQRAFEPKRMAEANDEITGMSATRTMIQSRPSSRLRRPTSSRETTTCETM